jgi:hypothetical protein
VRSKSYPDASCSLRPSLSNSSVFPERRSELVGDTALSALLRGKVVKVLAAAENTAGAFS